MNTYKHLCPHCMTTLSVDHIDELTMLVQCPICKKQLLLSDHGRSLREAPTIACIKCQHEMVYDGKAEEIVCDKCGEKFKVAKGGACIIETELYEKGQKGELPFTKFPDKVIARKNKARSIVSKCFGYGLWLAILAGIGWIVYKEATRPIPIENTLAFQDRDSLWCEFREKNPYNIQMEGIRKYPDGSYNLIISEPNPSIDQSSLVDFFEPYNSAVNIGTLSIGYDGWLKDAIVSFNGIKEKSLPKLEKKLSELLYGTNYKACFADFGTIPSYIPFSKTDLNYQVTEEELRAWFLENEEALFYCNDTTHVTTLSSALDSEKGTELLMSKAPGFVIWILNRGTCDASSFATSARQFSLDSDLILGAISTRRRVAIIGRERCESYSCMPPLRVETICTLARTTETELQQSYERNSLFAGKLPGGKDFAPIYLSKELWHTEFGSILNITDQMLKSWSENGNIDYVDFNHPKPVEWAFNKGAMKDLNASQLTYNWNTSGLGYIVEDEGYSIYALNRTGALPVSYIPGDADELSADDKAYLAEETAYDFFAELSNPHLVRVVQYMSLYQIFSNFGVRVVRTTTPLFDDGTIPSIPEALIPYGKRFLKELAKFDYRGIKTLAAEDDAVVLEEAPTKGRLLYYSDMIQLYEKGLSFSFSDGLKLFIESKVNAPTMSMSNGRNLSLKPNTYYTYEVWDNKWFRKKCLSMTSLDDIVSDCRRMKVLVGELHNASRPLYYLQNDQGVMEALVKWFAGESRNPNFEYSYSGEAQRLYEEAHKYAGLHFTFDGKDIIPDIKINERHYKDEIDDAFALFPKYSYDIHQFHQILSKKGEFNIAWCRDILVNENIHKYATWIKCPTIVESWNLTDSTTATGGHNLNSQITRFKVSDKVDAGSVKPIRGNKVLEISKQDRVSRVVDQGFLRRNARLGDSDIRGVSIPIRARASVIPSAPRKTRGYSAEEHLKIKVTESGHEINGKLYTDLTELLSDVGKFVADGESEVKKIEIQGLKTAGVDVDVYIDGVFGQLRKGSCASIPIDKYDVAHYTVETDGDVATVTIPIKPGTIKFGSTSNVRAEGLGGLTTATPSVKIKSGEVRFRVPKAHLEAFIQMIKDFISKQKGNWNEFKLKREMRQRGINPADCEEFLQLQVAKNNCIILKKGYKDVWVYSQQAIA